VVVQTYDVAGEGVFRLLPVTSHKGHGVGDVHILADTHMAHLHALAVSP